MSIEEINPAEEEMLTRYEGSDYYVIPKATMRKILVNTKAELRDYFSKIVDECDTYNALEEDDCVLIADLKKSIKGER